MTKFYHVEYFDIIMAALLIVFAFYTEVDFLCLSSTLFLVLLMSALIQHLKFFHGIEATQCLLNYKCHIFHPTYFGKLLQSSAKKSKACNPLTAHLFLRAIKILEYFYFKGFITSLWLYNNIDMFSHNINTCYVIYLRLFTNACKLHLKKHVSVKLTLMFILKNKAIHTKIILSSESTFKINGMLGRMLFLILLAFTPNLNVKII